MSKRAEIKQLPWNATHGASACYDYALSKAGRLSRVQRVPITSPWAARVAKQFRDQVAGELAERRENGHLTAVDFAALDSIYFAACGLVLAYGFLGKNGWISEDTKGFYPVTETAMRLQRLMKDTFAGLGIDKPPVIDIYAALYAQPAIEPPKPAPADAQLTTNGHSAEAGNGGNVASQTASVEETSG